MAPLHNQVKAEFFDLKEKMKRIAIQGLIGSFHDIAAHLYFEGEQIQLICCSTFEQVFDSIKQDPTAIGMLAIENTIAGSLLHNYELLRDSGTTVVGEHKLHITHSICCLPEDDWDTITEVHSHPVALMQCRQFLAQHPQLKNVEAEDTAGSAKMIAEGQHRGWAAICHAEAAKLYGLKVRRRTSRASSSRCPTRREVFLMCWLFSRSIRSISRRFSRCQSSDVSGSICSMLT